MRRKVPPLKEKRKKKLPKKVELTPLEAGKCALLEIEVIYDKLHNSWRVRRRGEFGELELLYKLEPNNIVGAGYTATHIPIFRHARTAIKAAIDPEKHGYRWLR